MKLSDELLLKSLRADVLGGVADDHWDLVCKAVDDANDIREVRGYARTVIFDAIEKFNPYHDQVGQFTSGGAGGASAGRSGGTKDFLDTTDIEPDMGTGASRTTSDNSPKITTSRGVSLKDADLSEISTMIRRDIKSQGKKVNFAAKPYLDALDTMGDIKDNYYEDSGTSVVSYLLGNLTTYKGETARAIKAELNARLKAERKK